MRRMTILIGLTALLSHSGLRHTAADSASVDYGPSISPLSWRLAEPSSAAAEKFSPSRDYLGVPVQINSIRMVEFNDARPYGESASHIVWLVRYEGVSIRAPSDEHPATLVLSLAFDVVTGGLVCAFTDPAAMWARSPRTSTQIESVGNQDCKYSPAQPGTLQSTLAEVLAEVWRSTGIDPRTAGQIVIRPRFAACLVPSKLVGDVHVPLRSPSNVWHLEVLGAAHWPRGREWTSTTVIATYSDSEKKMWSTKHID